MIKNSNLIHNIINVVITIVSGLALMDWNSLFGPEASLQIIAALGAAKLVMNAVRDGLAGMVKVQPPVE